MPFFSGSSKPFEAIFVSSNSKKNGVCDPLIVMLHGGPHSASLSSFSKSLAFLSSIGYSLLIVNYRLEEALNLTFTIFKLNVCCTLLNHIFIVV